jgi:hypothetical protein
MPMPREEPDQVVRAVMAARENLRKTREKLFLARERLQAREKERRELFRRRKEILSRGRRPGFGGEGPCIS